MARITNGITGAFSGKVGTVVGYTRNGQGFMRSLPREILKEPSQAQLDNRMKMASAQKWLKSIKAYVRVGFQNYSQKQHGFGSALSYIKLNAMREDFTVDPACAMISWGELPEAVNAGVSNPEPGILEVTWQPVEHNTDRAIILVYAGGEDFDGDLCGGRRQEGKHVLQCRMTTGKEADVYIGFISEERDKCSNSVYLGRINVQ